MKKQPANDEQQKDDRSLIPGETMPVMEEREPLQETKLGTQGMKQPQGHSSSWSCSGLRRMLDPRIVIVLIEAIPDTKEMDRCLYRRHTKTSRVSLCNARATGDCIGCGRSICKRHWSGSTIYIDDWEGMGTFGLCIQCAELSYEDLEALRAARTQLNRVWPRRSMQ